MKKFKICNLQSKIYNSSKGFTFIEMAMVLVVIGIIISMGVALVGPITKKIKRTDSKEIVNVANESVLGFVIKNKRLPTTEEFSSYFKDRDAWGNTLFYYADSNSTSGNICHSTSSGFQVNDEGTLKSNVAYILLSKGDNGTNDTGTSPAFTILEQSDTYDDLPIYGSKWYLINKAWPCVGLR